MHIGIDISQVVYEGTGVARFTRGLIDAILTYDHENQWSFFYSGLRRGLDPALEQSIHQAGQKTIRWYASPPLLSRMWNDRPAVLGSLVPSPSDGLSLSQKSKAFDAFISSDWTEPPPTIAKKKATIVHDLVFRRYPETVDPLILKTQKKRLDRLTAEADVIFCDSHTTAMDLRYFYPDTKGAVIVNFPGLTPLSLVPLPSAKSQQLTANSYLLSVGKLEPRKNIQSLLKAYKNAKNDSFFNGLDIELWIVGPEGWGDELTEIDPSVRFLGFVPDAELAQLYAQATAFIFPSIYEGFGIPALEAMSLGCPVAMSDSSSLAEIAEEDSALLFDPHDESSMTSALIKIATDTRLRESLIANGKKRAAEFTWGKYLDTLLGNLR